MIDISINEQYTDLINTENLVKVANDVLSDQLPGQERDLTIAIEDNDCLHDLNKQYRSVDSTTDVLSFQADEYNPETGQIYLGDIIISYPQALLQAKSANHPVDEELKLLVIHGVLHLLGYDHEDDKDKAEMWSSQTRLISKLEVKINQSPYLE